MTFYEIIKEKMMSIKHKKKLSDDDKAFIEFYNDPEIVSYRKQVEKEANEYDTKIKPSWKPTELPLYLSKIQDRELKKLYNRLIKWYNEYENKSEKMILEFNRIFYYGQEFAYRRLEMLISFYTKYTKIEIDLDRILNSSVEKDTNQYRNQYEIDIDYREVIPENMEKICRIDNTFRDRQYRKGVLYSDSVYVFKPRTFRINKKDPNIYECMINTWCDPKYEAVRTYIISRTSLNQMYFYFTTKEGKRCVGYCSFNYQKSHRSFFGKYGVPYFYPIWPQMHYDAAITRHTFRKCHDSFSYCADEIGSIYCKPMTNLSKIYYCRNVELFDDIIKKSYRESQYRFLIFSIEGYYREKEELYIPAKLVSRNNSEDDLYWCPIWEKDISKELIDDNIVLGPIPARDPIVVGISIEPITFPDNICD